MNMQKINARKLQLGKARVRRMVSRMSLSGDGDACIAVIMNIAETGLWREWGYASIEDYFAAEMGIKGRTLTNVILLLKQKGVYDESTNN